MTKQESLTEAEQANLEALREMYAELKTKQDRDEFARLCPKKLLPLIVK